jgi:hypothetical protein
VLAQLTGPPVQLINSEAHDRSSYLFAHLRG